MATRATAAPPDLPDLPDLPDVIARESARPRVAIVTTADWYFWSHRLPVARAVRDAGCEVLVIAPEERAFGPRIEAEGFQFVPLPMVRGSTQVGSEFGTLRHLLRLYRVHRPELVHHVGVKPVIYGSVAARITGIRGVINAVAGQGYLSRIGGVKGAVLRTMGRVAFGAAYGSSRTRAIFQNPEDLDAFVEAGIVPRARTTLIRGSGVDLDQFVPAPEPAATPVIVFASRLMWSKGIGDLVEAKRLLDRRHVAARLIIVGIPDLLNPESVQEKDLRAWAAEGVAEWIGLREDMPAVLASANIVALPSVYGEGVPKILIEAAAAARSIVATDIPGCREIVRDGVNGLLVPPNDPSALAAALERLLGDTALRASMGAAGRTIAVNEFGIEGVVARTLDVYRELLGSRWPARS